MVRLGTPADRTVYAQAEEQFARDLFGGATIRDAQSGVIRFAATDYDAYQAHVRERPELGRKVERLPSIWPTLYISFFTRRLPVEPGSGRVASGRFYFCDTGDPLSDPLVADFLGAVDVMWKGRIVTDRVAAEIKDALDAAPEPQEFEIAAPYTHVRERPWPVAAKVVTLMPPSGDLCFALVESGYPPVAGKPLRIDGRRVAEVLGPLPRSLTLAAP